MFRLFEVDSENILSNYLYPKLTAYIITAHILSYCTA